MLAYHRRRRSERVQRSLGQPLQAAFGSIARVIEPNWA
jgi:hypothetical protein